MFDSGSPCQAVLDSGSPIPRSAGVKPWLKLHFSRTVSHCGTGRPSHSMQHSVCQMQCNEMLAMGTSQAMWMYVLAWLTSGMRA